MEFVKIYFAVLPLWIVVGASMIGLDWLIEKGLAKIGYGYDY